VFYLHVIVLTWFYVYILLSMFYKIFVFNQVEGLHIKSICFNGLPR